MKQHRGRIVHVHRPPIRLKRLLGRDMTSPPKPARISVRLDYGETLRILPEPTGVRLVGHDRVTCYLDQRPGRSIGPPQKDGN